MRILAILLEGEAIRTILEHLGLPTSPPARALAPPGRLFDDNCTNDSAPSLHAGCISASRLPPEPVFRNTTYMIAPSSIRTSPPSPSRYLVDFRKHLFVSLIRLTLT